VLPPDYTAKDLRAQAAIWAVTNYDILLEEYKETIDKASFGNFIIQTLDENTMAETMSIIFVRKLLGVSKS